MLDTAATTNSRVSAARTVTQRSPQRDSSAPDVAGSNRDGGSIRSPARTFIAGSSKERTGSGWRFDESWGAGRRDRVGDCLVIDDLALAEKTTDF